ncbi:MAG: YbgC/FadM family acyl-CoA thioesterase [bacterium]|jgi:tol-pal system-associated acyl-CoA thioesterase|nr:YbgC/FadM family acyl-CoA thioesterase [Betaproteobacteria bacterium]
MSRPEPVAVVDAARVHRLPVRVYYQDTDAGGVVFHAAYLSFLERARTEFLRSIGFDIGRLAEEGVLFALHRLEMEFLKPARLDDALQVTAAVGHLGRTSARFLQTVERADGSVAIRASLSLVCVSATRFRPMGIPEPLREALESWTLPAGGAAATGAAADNGVEATG